jgi:hypothetical protein
VVEELHGSWLFQAENCGNGIYVCKLFCSFISSRSWITGSLTYAHMTPLHLNTKALAVLKEKILAFLELF